jgi:alginate O-acetyltransferase complex protein AlgJ
VQQTGDIVPMLDLPEGQRLYPPESVWLRRVVNADGTVWRSSREADVLVLGDSFSNVYSLESMGWGTSAGFVEQLSYALRRPIDRILQNDDGAFATRDTRARRRPAEEHTRRRISSPNEPAFGD